MPTRNELYVGISEYKIAKAPQQLIAAGLGSCVGTVIYNRKAKIGGLCHIMLPDSLPFQRKNMKSAKFADLALPLLVTEIKKRAKHGFLEAKIVGGANMFQFSSLSNAGNIGKRNVEAVERILQELKIPIVGKHVGGYSSRTMIVDLHDFTTSVRVAAKEIIHI